MLTEADIDIHHGEPESRSLDIKEKPPATQKLLRHIQGGANGEVPNFRIIIGAKEGENGQYDKTLKKPIKFPLSVEGVKTPFLNFDKYRLHLIDLVKSQTSDYIEGFFDIQLVEVSGGSLIIIDVPQSSDRPHQNTNTGSYYIRRDGKTDKMTAEEVKKAYKTVPISALKQSKENSLFLPGDVVTDASDKAFSHGIGKVCLVKGPLAYLRVISEGNTQTWSGTKLLALLDNSPTPFVPFGRMINGASHRNEHGCLAWAVPDDVSVTPSLTQVYENGEIAGMDTGLITEGIIPSAMFVDQYQTILPTYLQMARDVFGLTEPFKIVAGVSGVKGARLALAYNNYSQKALKDRVEITSNLKDDTASTALLLQPFFKALWEECGSLFP